MSVENVNIMKRKSQWSFTGICNCGRYHSFKMSDFDFNKSTKDGFLLLKEPFTCQHCNATFNKLVNKEKKLERLTGYGILGIISLLLLFGGYKIISPFFDFTSHDSPTSIDDMTNKQYKEFQKWQDKQDKQKWENQKVGDNN